MSNIPMDLVLKVNGISSNGIFSHNSVAKEKERLKLEENYKHLLQETNVFSRKTVSFQGNKVEALHRWMKYREGFSADLVKNLFSELGLKKGATVLDPFAGSCTTMLQAQVDDMNSIGVELLPNCHLAWKVKSRVYDYDVSELERLLDKLKNENPALTKKRFPHINITDSAFPELNEERIMAYTQWLSEIDFSQEAKDLCRLIIMDSLEDLSYTRKDGQYLRWDSRARKIIERNNKRESEGKKAVKGIDKGVIPDTKSILVKRFDKIIEDIKKFQAERTNAQNNTSHTLIEGNTLFELPRLQPSIFNAVITSPPYLNRYDYTRTYALELAYLNIDSDIFNLRQSLLSATVESKSKISLLEGVYSELGLHKSFKTIRTLIDNNNVLNEILEALNLRNKAGEVNNKGIIAMVKQYFEELTFIYFELFRLSKPGGYVVFVNDNVRYAGEIIPVDTLSTHIAESVGFKPIKILVIPQKKGNSSQQMKKYGKIDLRKSITVWQKI